MPGRVIRCGTTASASKLNIAGREITAVSYRFWAHLYCTLTHRLAYRKRTDKSRGSTFQRCSTLKPHARRGSTRRLNQSDHLIFERLSHYFYPPALFIPPCCSEVGFRSRKSISICRQSRLSHYPFAMDLQSLLGKKPSSNLAKHWPTPVNGNRRGEQ